MVGRTSNKRSLEIAVTIVLALFYGYSVFSTLSIPDTAFFGGDTWEYQSIAVNFAAGKGFRFGGLLPFETYRFDSADPDFYDRFLDAGSAGGEPSTYRTPGYPFVLAIIYRIFGVSPRAAITIQIGWLILICAVLPSLGKRLLGRGGFAAGLIAGLIFHKLAPNIGGVILTEALIALSLFMVLVAWLIMHRTDRPTLPAAAFFGLMLALAVLVKGSLIFLPPLFLGFIALQVFRGDRYRFSTLAISLLTFILPLAAYSIYASHISESVVILSTQGEKVLLGGHNEVSVQTGGWSRCWQDPDSFYSRQHALDPERPASMIVASFYLENPRLLPQGIQRKLISMFGNRTALLVGFAVIFGLAAFLTCLGGSQRFQRSIACGAVAAIPGTVVLLRTPEMRAGLVTFAFGPGLLLFALACGNRCFRRRIASIWSAPGYAAVTFIVVNFVLLTIITFGDPRFLSPARFVLLLGGAFLLIRLAEAIELPVDIALTLEEKGSDMLVSYYRHFRRIVYSRVADELASFAPYFDCVSYWSTSEDDILQAMLPAADLQTIDSAEEIKARADSEDVRDLTILNGVLNSTYDIQEVLMASKEKMARGDRLAAVLYNPYFRWVYSLADRLGLRSAPPARTFVTHVDLYNLAKISGFEVVRLRPVSPFPLRLLGLGSLIDAIWRTLPIIRQLSPVQIAVLRPVIRCESRPSITVVIPARNERGNIRSALERLPEIPGADVEVIFVEGHSTDGTWDEIQQVVAEHNGVVKVRACQQTGKGKADAVRMAFGMASGELLTILDADLTMPPELLPRFYDAFCAGDGDFINGSRLVYPMESQAMRHLNRLGNIFFSKALSWVLEVRLGDTLCGTKLVTAPDYRRMMEWRNDFGDFDPFGDFEVLFPAAVLTLGVVDVPIRYRDRVYGSTNISRFRHGMDLMRMTLIGLIRIRMGLGNTAKWDRSDGRRDGE